MKIVLKGVENVFDTEQGFVNEIIIENQRLLVAVLDDFYGQMNGISGKNVISKDNKILPTEKVCEVISSYIPFEINTKSLVNKLIVEFEKKAISSDYYVQTMEEISAIERYMEKVVFELPGNIVCSKLDIKSIIKAVGLKFCDDYISLPEKLIDYMELVREYDCEKLFVMVNLRSYVSDRDMELFVEEVLEREYHIVIIEGSERTKISSMQRYIIDVDLCEIC